MDLRVHCGLPFLDTYTYLGHLLGFVRSIYPLQVSYRVLLNVPIFCHVVLICCGGFDKQVITIIDIPALMRRSKRIPQRKQTSQPQIPSSIITRVWQRHARPPTSLSWDPSRQPSFPRQRVSNTSTTFSPISRSSIKPYFVASPLPPRSWAGKHSWHATPLPYPPIFASQAG